MLDLHGAISLYRSGRALTLAALACVAVTSCGSTADDGEAIGAPEVRLEMTLRLRGAGRGVAFSPSGLLLATASVDSTVRLWQLPSGAPLGELRHPAGVTALSFSPNGRTLVTASYDGTVRTWDVDARRLMSQWPGDGSVVWTVAHSPDGTLVASAGEDRLIHVRGAYTGDRVRDLAGHARNVWSVAFTADGSHLVSGSFDRSFRRWELAGRGLATVVGLHGQAVVAVATSGAAGVLASAGDDATINLWDAASNTLVRRMPTGADHIYSLAFSADGRWLVSGGRGQGAIGTVWKQLAGPRFSPRGRTVRLWRVADGNLLHVLRAHEDDAWGVAISPDGTWIAASGEDATVRLWRRSPPPRSRATR